MSERPRGAGIVPIWPGWSAKTRSKAFPPDLSNACIERFGSARVTQPIPTTGGNSYTKGQKMWDKASLHDLITTRMTDYQMSVVANREPYIHRFAGDSIECQRPASGMAAALDPVSRDAGGGGG